jgi:rfaE bifunctional protein kinase chain/domain
VTVQHPSQSQRASRAGLRMERALVAPTPLPLSPSEKHERHWPHHLGEIIASFAGKRVLVIGDMIADDYIIGAATRMSREAPIPVIMQRERFIVPGGAMNPAVNARALGAEVHVLGLIGDDETGRRLRQRLSELGIHHDLLFTEAQRPTSTKMRVLAGNSQGTVQHIARVDTIDNTPPDSATIQRALRGIEQKVPAMDAIIFSDYDNGFMLLPIIECALHQTARHDRVSVADAHGRLHRYHGVTAITPNQTEAETEAGIPIRDHSSLQRAGQHLLANTNAQGVLITRGGDGMSLFLHDGSSFDIPAYPSEVRDTIGAGDTVTATFALGLATGASMADAATIANVAAGLVVRRLGCATTTPDELHHAVAGLEATW